VLSLSALAHPVRRRIVELLAEEEYTAGEIIAEFDMSAPSISLHLKLLREADLIRVKAEGQRRVYSLNPAGFAELDAWMHRMERVWSRPNKPPEKPVATRRATKPKPAAAPETAGPDTGWEIIKMENP
jgi:DNA-binding transcriptional ArsR family regulator